MAPVSFATVRNGGVQIVRDAADGEVGVSVGDDDSELGGGVKFAGA
jgi:hypothetical protein